MGPASELQTLPKAAAQDACFASCSTEVDPKNLSAGLLQTEISPLILLSHCPSYSGLLSLLLLGSTGCMEEQRLTGDSDLPTETSPEQKLHLHLAQPKIHSIVRGCDCAGKSPSS